MSRMQLKGIITANVTPFTKEGEVHEKGLRDVVEFQIEKRASMACSSVVLLGRDR